MERAIIIEGIPYKFSLNRSQDIEWISVSGKTHQVRFHLLPDGRRLCIVDGKVIEWDGSPNCSYRLVRNGGQTYHLEVIDPRRRISATSPVRAATGYAELKAPMAGKVVAVLCKEGQEIRVNQGIVVLEAMKMENELRSPIAGVVTSLEVRLGEAVETGQKVAMVESASARD